MGFFLIFFHHPLPLKHHHHHPLKSSITNTTTPLLSKTQSTLSICFLVLFTTLLYFFTLSTTSSLTTLPHLTNRRLLRHAAPPPHHALHGMGHLFLRGTKSMSDLVVGHVPEGTTLVEVTTFLRLYHHSGLLSRSDLVLIFDSLGSASRLGRVVKSECDSFLRLINGSGLGPSQGPGRAGLARYMRRVGEGDKGTMWGWKGSDSGELTRASYGSVVGFYASELDPEDSLSGFLNRAPLGLRRWACYPMLLGRIRRNFKHTMLVDVKNSLVLSDPFSPVRNRSAESVFLYPESTRSHGRKNSVGGLGTVPRVDSKVVIGGARGIRRLANAALIEIVRAAIEHKGKGKNSVTESGLVNQLVHNGPLLKKINLINPTESIPVTSSLVRVNSGELRFLGFGDYFPVVQRGHGDNFLDIDYVIKKEICLSHGLYSSVYRDCLASQ